MTVYLSINLNILDTNLINNNIMTVNKINKLTNAKSINKLSAKKNNQVDNLFITHNHIAFYYI